MNKKQKKETEDIASYAFAWRIFLAGAALVSLYVLLIVCGNDTESISSRLGTLGDFIGGLLNPVLSLMALTWLRVSVHVQKSELHSAKEALSLQQFEQTFFNLLQGLTSASADLANSERMGGIKWLMNQIGSKNSHKEVLSNLRENIVIFDIYMKKLCFLLQYIATHQNNLIKLPIESHRLSEINVEPKEFFYAEIVKSSIIRDEAILIAFAAHLEFEIDSENKSKQYNNLFDLVVRYQLLDGFDGQFIPDSATREIFGKFPTSTFGGDERFLVIMS